MKKMGFMVGCVRSRILLNGCDGRRVMFMGSLLGRNGGYLIDVFFGKGRKWVVGRDGRLMGMKRVEFG